METTIEKISGWTGLSTTTTTASLAAAGAAAATLLLSRLFSSKSRPSGVYVVVVRLRVHEGMVERFLSRWKVLADYCHKHEKGTLSYQASVSTTDNSEVLIFERYSSEKDFEDHQKSPAFLKFREEMAEFVDKRRTTHTYFESVPGYMDK